jgi:hypothetical protein
MFSQNTHRKIFIFFLLLLVIGLTFGKLILSISMIGLAVNWLFEGRFTEKHQRIKSRKYVPYFLAGIFLIEVFWVIFSEDWIVGLNVLRIKLPLLILPIVIGSSKMLLKKELRLILFFFVLSGFVSSVLVYAVDLGLFKIAAKTITGRNISLFMSHIRYSIVLSFIVNLLLYLMIRKKINNFAGILLSLWFVNLLFKIASLTAIIGLFFSVILLLLFFLKRIKKQTMLGLSALALFITLFFGVILNTIISDFYTPKRTTPSKELPKQTKLGEKYIHDLENETLENGYYIWRYIAETETEKAWNKTSVIPFNEIDKKHQKIKYTLYRYLTSKGLRKDEEGVNQLTLKDIQLIENGNTSHVKYNRLETRIRGILMEWEDYKNTNNPNNHTLLQRFSFWKIAIEIIKKSPFIGHGTGGHKIEFKNYYENNTTILNKSNQLLTHNQFLTQIINLGFLGFIPWIGLLAYSIKKSKINELLIAFACLMFFALISDDILERQVGVTIFSSILTILLFYNRKEKELLTK